MPARLTCASSPVQNAWVSVRLPRLTIAQKLRSQQDNAVDTLTVMGSGGDFDYFADSTFPGRHPMPRAPVMFEENTARI